MRCESWLKVALCYAKNLPEMEAVLEKIKGFGILITQARVSLQTTGLVTQYQRPIGMTS